MLLVSSSSSNKTDTNPGMQSPTQRSNAVQLHRSKERHNEGRRSLKASKRAEASPTNTKSKTNPNPPTQQAQKAKSLSESHQQQQ
jgi:hypothetical protein